MNRRQFISNSLLTTGGVLIGTNILRAHALKEINQQFSVEPVQGDYDLIINGAGLAGYYAAIEAVGRGLRVLILDKRTSPGYDIAAKGKLWINHDGIGNFNNDHYELFFPEGERGEILPDRKKLKSPENSLFDDEYLLFAGSVKKGMLRNLLLHKVHVMLMTDVCGIITGNTSVQGVLAATKQGLYTIKCKSFIDATENVLFTRQLFNQEYAIKKAGFVIELIDVVDPQKTVIRVDDSFNILNNTIELHKGKKSKDQQFISFEFKVDGNDISAIELKARFIAAQLSKNFPSVDSSFNKARLYNQALECSFYLEKNALPEITLEGYYCTDNPSIPGFTCSDLLETARSSKALAGKVKPQVIDHKNREIRLPGETIARKFSNKENLVTEEGITLPLTPFFPDNNFPVQRIDCQVLVAGGGTAGSTAAMGAAQKGAFTLLTEYFNDLGGTKTMGGVSGYYHGVMNHPFIVQHEKNIAELRKEFHMSGGIDRRFYLLKTLTEQGVKILTGAIICGAVTKGHQLTATYVCENGKLKKLHSTIAIDATGDADLACFAGVEYTHGNSRTGITQNYSQWDISGRTNMPSNINRDYDIIDNTKISEMQRGLFLSHYESHFYDFFPMLTVREARMPKGIYTLNLKDVFEVTHFEDCIARASSDFDPHYVGSSAYSRCGFLLPHSNKTTIEIPFRSIVPEKTDGLLLSGRGISHTNNAMQFTRMSGDVTTLGYITGQIASEISLTGRPTREYSVTPLQKAWRDKGFLPDEPSAGTLETAHDKVTKLQNGEGNYLLKCCLLPEKESLPVLLEAYQLNPNLLLAKALAWFSNPTGVHLIIRELEDLVNEENRTDYGDNFMDKYDVTGLYWRINQHIALLALAGDKKCNETIGRILNNTVSGGGMVTRESIYYDNRIDLKLIPQYNRITNLCFYIERQPDAVFISGLEKLLRDKNIGGFRTTDYDKPRWRVYGADLEIYIASALARCGALSGLKLLTSYLDEIHSNFRGYAHKELKAITGKDYGFSQKEWTNYLNNLSLTHKPTGISREIEL